MESKARKQGRVNPRERAGPISALLFGYLFPIFVRGFRKGFKEEDLYEALPEHKSKKLGNKLEGIWKEEYRKNKKYALHIALLRMFGLQLFVTGIFKFINEIMFVVVMPLSIGGLVSYFETGPPAVTETKAFFYAGLVIVCLLLDGFLSHPVIMYMMHMCMKMRVACCSLLYRKSLRLSRSSLGKTTVGQVVNLLSNDVSKFDHGFVLCHYIWLGPLQTAVGTYLLYKEVGLASLGGIGFLLIFIPVQIYLGKRTSVLRLRTAVRTDERVRLMNEIISGIQVIKMYTWEKPFAKLISAARRKEIKPIRAHAYLIAIMYCLEMFVTRASIFITVVTYVYLGHTITAQLLFSITAVYNVLRPVITMLFSISLSSIAEVYISVSRIQNFLSSEEVTEDCCIQSKSSSTSNGVDQSKSNGIIARPTPYLNLENVCAKWFKEANEYTLTDINLELNSNRLVAIIGPVGSGKSSLFSVILREMAISSGTREVNGIISYASQEPWLFGESVRQNILFGDPFDEARYRKVVKVCALEADFKLLPFGDRTLVGEKGKSLSGGQKARVNLARAVYKRADIYLLDDPLSAVDTKVGKQLFDNCIRAFLRDKLCILITHQLQYLKNAEEIVIMDDGKIVGHGTFHSLQASGLNFAKLLQEYHNAEEQEEVDRKSLLRNNSQTEGDADEEDQEKEEELLKSGGIKATVYLQFLRAGGNYFVIFLLAMAFIVSQFVANGSDYFISYWANHEQIYNEKVRNNETTEPINRDQIIEIYSVIIVALIAIALGHCMFFFYFFMRAAVRMHDRIFAKISFATMRFFNANPTGRILNRFSKDIGLIDEYIPYVLDDVLEIGLLLAGAIITTSIVSPWLLVPSAGLMVVFYLLRVVYIKTSRSVKRIEGITRSPIYSHMTTSINGLSTIRAFSAQHMLIEEFDNHQDHHSSAWYLFIAASRAFGLWLDFVCIVFISGIIVCLIFLREDYYGGDVGLIITQYLGLTGILQWGMRQWSELENQMTSVERVLEYADVETEPIRRPIANLPKDWPTHGHIVFENVSMRYNPDDKPVLNQLNFTIESGEKVGVVGRTGAGKSSMIAALFQLYAIDGRIIIDDLDTTQLPLEELRAKISIIPQEPVLFSGTMRKNLDPFDEYNDEILWNALEQVELKEVILDLPAGLSSTVSEGGTNFSVGQRQLVCLARAIARRNKILVMDEATANVDPHTDTLIQRTIRKEFNDCTVITIAHRLHTIMDSDKVLVMSKGRVVEFDHPHQLVQNKDGVFNAMVQTVGKNTARHLETIAEKHYLTKKTE